MFDFFEEMNVLYLNHSMKLSNHMIRRCSWCIFWRAVGEQSMNLHETHTFLLCFECNYCLFGMNLYYYKWVYTWKLSTGWSREKLHVIDKWALNLGIGINPWRQIKKIPLGKSSITQWLVDYLKFYPSF